MEENKDNGVKLEETEKKQQTPLRLDPDVRQEFFDFCDQHGMNRSDGLKSLLHAVELGRAADAMPERAAEMTNIKRLLDELQESYLHSFDLYLNTKENVREEFRVRLESQQKTISDLQGKQKELEEGLKAAEQAVNEAKAAQLEAEKTAEIDRKLRESAEQTAADKQTIADTIGKELADAKAKLEGYDELKTELADAKTTIPELNQQIKEIERNAADVAKDYEQQIKDAKRDADEAAKDAAREADKKLSEAVAAEKAKAQEEKNKAQAKIDELKDQVRNAKSEADAAKKDAETANAKATALEAASERDRAAIIKLQARVDELTNELLALQKSPKA